MGVVDQAAGHVSGRSVAVFVAASATLYYVLGRFDRRRRRRKLGPPAPTAPYRLPWGIVHPIAHWPRLWILLTR